MKLSIHKEGQDTLLNLLSLTTQERHKPKTLSQYNLSTRLITNSPQLSSAAQVQQIYLMNRVSHALIFG